MREGVATAQQVQGKELSYNNINDTDAAFELVSEFDPPTARPVPSSNTPIRVAWHAVPICQKRCQSLGVRSGFSFRRHYCHEPPAGCDHRQSDSELFTEVIIAPGADDAARDIIAAKKNLRLLITTGLADRMPKA